LTSGSATTYQWFLDQEASNTGIRGIDLPATAV